MGWASGTELFDEVVDAVLSELGWVGVDDRRGGSEDLDNCIEAIIVAFERADWDTQNESQFYDHGRVNKAFRKLHPKWFEDKHK